MNASRSAWLLLLLTASCAAPPTRTTATSPGDGTTPPAQRPTSQRSDTQPRQSTSGSVPPAASPSAPPFDTARMAAADKAIDAAIAKGETPGAVLLVGRGDRTGGRVLYRKAYGNRAVRPAAEPMTPDTIFDLASLSKSVGCATSLMTLIDQGKVDPQAPVARYLPEFGQNGKESITVAQLLLHQGGLIPDNAIGDYADHAARAWEKICALKPQAPPGTAFKYSDVGFIVLGKLVERVLGVPLNVYAAEHVFEPAGMAHTRYLPPEDWKANTAPTEQREGRWMRGEVHDPRSYAMGGVAGHAGVFSSADDLARYCRMLLDGGTIDGHQVLSKEAVRTMTTPHGLPDGSNRRTYGFDVDTAYSRPRGERFERGTTFGHTGFTGTSFWLDPVNDCFVILLTNAVHPDGKGKVLNLRHDVATIAAEALLGPGAPATKPADARPATEPSATAAAPVRTGIDVLEAGHFATLKGKRVALVTNQTGLDHAGRRTIDLLQAADGVRLVKLFSPEHGLFGLLDEKVADAVDPATKLHVYSLYGETRKPTPAMMEGVDVLVLDIQDAGARYYTYLATMGNCMEACAAAKVKMLVLDRPNPVNGEAIEGPIADEKALNFTAYYRMPIRHGMTVGELARLFNAEKKIGCELDVVAMENWRRSMWFDETQLTWVNPSPNLRNPTQALLYLGVGQIEFADVSVGRGTDQPFELLGAPWIDGQQLAAALNDGSVPGLRFTPIRFTPASSKFAGKSCGGVYIGVVDRSKVEPVKMGTAVAWTLHRLYGSKFDLSKVNLLVKNEQTTRAIQSADSWQSIPNGWEIGLADFMTTRQKYLIYP